MDSTSRGQPVTVPNTSSSGVELDPLVVQAAREVDLTLLDWSLRLSPRERLRACTNASVALGRFKRGSSPSS